MMDRDIRGQVQTIHSTAFLRSSWILRRDQQTQGKKKTKKKKSANSGVKNPEKLKFDHTNGIRMAYAQPRMRPTNSPGILRY